MSMQKLSTELDENIIQRLGGDDLARMMGVSRYHRKLLEPLLYKDLNFHTDRYYRITLLFRTLLGRRALAKLTRSLKLTFESSPQTHMVVTSDYHRCFWNMIPAVRDMISGIGQGLDMEFVSNWFGRIYASSSSFDGALAAILCLATNLEHLDIEARSNELFITSKILNWSWPRNDNGPETFPFCKLKSLCIRGDIWEPAPVLPCLESLSLISDKRAYFRNAHFVHFPHPSRAIGTNLRALELRKINAGPTAYEEILSFPQLRNVKELKVSWIYVGYGDPWEDYNLHRMTQVIEAHLPDLEVLHWTHHELDRESTESRTFGSFKGLSKLRELNLDVHLLERADVDGHPCGEVLPLTCPEEYLPDSLKVLHVTNLGPREPTTDLFLEVARTIGLETVELSLDLEDWFAHWANHSDTGVRELRKTRREFFRDLVTNMAASGVTMRVWRQEGKYPEKLLFAPGFQRPWPIWEDAEKRHWRKRVLIAWEAKEGGEGPSESDDDRDFDRYLSVYDSSDQDDSDDEDKEKNGSKGNSSN